jgi:hypothetical protein
LPLLWNHVGVETMNVGASEDRMPRYWGVELANLTVSLAHKVKYCPSQKKFNHEPFPCSIAVTLPA